MSPIERVVVPLDATSDSHAAIETAARLAARAKAPLRGVFVEDEDLLHLAALPFSRQVTLGIGAEALTTEGVVLHLKAAAERSRKELFAAAKRHGVECSFEIVRGASGSAVSNASEGDLVVAGGHTRPIGRHFRMECRWWSSFAVAPAPFLMVRHGWRTGGAVVMLLRDRSRAASRLLAAAAEVARTADRALTVICPPEIAGKAGFEKWITDQLAGSPVRLQIEVAPDQPAALRARIDELGCTTLAVDAGATEGDSGRLREFVEGFACDILVVR